MAVLGLVVFTTFAAQATVSCETLFDQTDLALKEDSAWLIQKFGSGAKDFSGVDAWARKQGTGSADRWITVIGHNYRLIPKVSANPMNSQRFVGRRLLDRALTILERQDLAFKNAATEGISANEQLEKFYQNRQKQFGTEYDGKAVFSVIRYLKNQLKTIAPREKQLRFLLSGSFANGKADLTKSDIDLSITDASFVRSTKALEPHIIELLKKSYPKTQMPLEIHGEPMQFYGKTNAFVFEITESRVDLWVFPPAQTSFTVGLTAGTPTKYQLDEFVD